MPRSRTRKKRNGRRPVPRMSDADALLTLLDIVDSDDMLGDAFERAAWSFCAAPGPVYVQPDSVSEELAWLRAREWFLFEMTLPSGMSPIEQWAALDGEGRVDPRLASPIERFHRARAGLFLVQDARADGSLLLEELGSRKTTTAFRFDGLERFVEHPAELPVFEKGDLIGGRLYESRGGRMELLPGTDRLPEEMKQRALADPAPEMEEQEAGLAVEAAFGANPFSIAAVVVESLFPSALDEFLFAVSDGTFDYPRLWRELQDEQDGVQVARQALSELDAWTRLEPHLLAIGISGAWLRRRGDMRPADGVVELSGPDAVLLAKHAAEALDSDGDPELPLAPPSQRLSLSRAVRQRIATLPVNSDLEWVVDVCPFPNEDSSDTPDSDRTTAEGLETDTMRSPVCAIVEDQIIDWDAVAPDDLEDDADEESSDDEFDDEVDGEVEDELDGAVDGDVDEEEPLDDEEPLDEGPELLIVRPLPEGREEADHALATIIEALGQERETRPARIVLRQRHVAARLRETLEEAGFEVAVRYFTEVVEVALTETLPDDLDEA